MGSRLKIANDHNIEYQLFSNTPIPQNVKEWLTSKGIKYIETLE